MWRLGMQFAAGEEYEAFKREKEMAQSEHYYLLTAVCRSYGGVLCTDYGVLLLMLTPYKRRRVNPIEDRSRS